MKETHHCHDGTDNAPDYNSALALLTANDVSVLGLREESQKKYGCIPAFVHNMPSLADRTLASSGTSVREIPRVIHS
jgi:hypothetical protein